MKTSQILKNAYSLKASQKIVKGLDDDDWVTTPISEEEPMNGFPDVPLVKAGDGGMWVPVYIYIPKEELPDDQN